MTEHVGIVACSAEGAALCYRTICHEGARLLGPRAHPQVSMHTHSLADYVRCLERHDLAGVAALMADSGRRLAAAGADFLVCPDNTIHQAHALATAQTVLPWLHIAEAVADEAAARGYRRLGLLGTHWLIDSDVYPSRLGARGMACVKPGAQDRDAVGRIIMDELVRGDCSPASVAVLQAVVRQLADRGCDAVVLGCTELPLALDDTNAALPTLDSTRLLARAALRRATRTQESQSPEAP